ncbi:Hsp70 protein-domain-containing protein [Suillus occidentalis]|nr:Hsp70 protein-domain-containing protein [Suillus occidentalis]
MFINHLAQEGQISLPTLVLSVIYRPLASVPSVPFRQQHRLPSRLTAPLSHALFEELMLEPVEKVLWDSQIDKANIHEIVLIGGSTYIPHIVKLVSDFFDDKEPNRSINPGEPIAYGAAVQAAILFGDTSEKTQDLLLLDVIPLLLGIETASGDMTAFIKCNTTVPTGVSSASLQVHSRIQWTRKAQLSSFEGPPGMLGFYELQLLLLVSLCLISLLSTMSHNGKS